MSARISKRTGKPVRKYDKYKSWGGSGICKYCREVVPFLMWKHHTEDIHHIDKDGNPLHGDKDKREVIEAVVHLECGHSFQNLASPEEWREFIGKYARCSKCDVGQRPPRKITDVTEKVMTY